MSEYRPGYPENYWRFSRQVERAFMPLAWVLVRVPGLRMALSRASLDEAFKRIYRDARRETW